MVAHSWGLVSESWARTWLQIRRNLKQNAKENGNLMQGVGADYYPVEQTVLTTANAGIILREILGRAEPSMPVHKFTAHSLKVTCLSWTGKAGLDIETRRVLGYHSKQGDRMVNLYARETYAEPLRKLGHVLLWIACGKFIPDDTMSGRWVGSHPSEDGFAKDFDPTTLYSSIKNGEPEGPPPEIAQARERAAEHLSAEIPRLQASLVTDQVELPISDESEGEDLNHAEDEATLIAMGTAGVIMAAQAEIPERDREDSQILFAPPQFKLLRHKTSNQLHWSKNGVTPFCNGDKNMPPGGTRWVPENYRPTNTYGDPPCYWCRRQAKSDYGIDATEWTHGKHIRDLPKADQGKNPQDQTSTVDEAPSRAPDRTEAAASKGTTSSERPIAWGVRPSVKLALPHTSG
jgi:hypothetical protein